MTHAVTRIPLSEAQTLLDQLQPLLEKHKLENSLFLDRITRLINNSETTRYNNPFVARVEDSSGNVVGGVVHTPPLKIIVSFPFPDAAIRAVTQLYDNVADAIGVQCTITTANSLRNAFLELPSFEGVKATIEREMRLHKVSPDELILPDDHKRAEGGSLRLATGNQVELLETWCMQFQEDCNIPPQTRVANRAAKLINDQVLYIWEVDGEPVSMAAVTGHDALAPRVGWVFTPNEFRGKGYASNCVAGLCLYEFKQFGWPFITLFTDLANPTSNKVYQSIGFTAVIDLIAYDFVVE